MSLLPTLLNDCLFKNLRICLSIRSKINLCKFEKPASKEGLLDSSKENDSFSQINTFTHCHFIQLADCFDKVSILKDVFFCKIQDSLFFCKGNCF